MAKNKKMPMPDPNEPWVQDALTKEWGPQSEFERTPFRHSPGDITSHDRGRETGERDYWHKKGTPLHKRSS